MPKSQLQGAPLDLGWLRLRCHKETFVPVLFGCQTTTEMATEKLELAQESHAEKRERLKPGMSQGGSWSHRRCHSVLIAVRPLCWGDWKPDMMEQSGHDHTCIGTVWVCVSTALFMDFNLTLYI